MNSANERDREKKPPDKYKKDHEFYTVHLKSSERIEGGIPKIKTATKVFNVFKEQVTALKKITKDIMRVDFKTKEVANKAVEEQPLDGMIFFIPFHAKYSIGIVRDIDIDQSDEMLLELFNGSVDRIQRMYRFNADKNQREPTRSIKIFIESDELPDYLTVYGMRFAVQLFQQRVRACFKCHAYGHNSFNCRAELNKCRNCGEYCTSDCKKNKFCHSCNNNDHSFHDDKCPVKKIEESIVKVMQNNKLSYFEAKDWIKANVCAEAFSLIVKSKNFPTINENLRAKGKKLTKVERNNIISLQIITTVNELKARNNINKNINKELIDNSKSDNKNKEINNTMQAIAHKRGADEEIISDSTEGFENEDDIVKPKATDYRKATTKETDIAADKIKKSGNKKKAKK